MIRRPIKDRRIKPILVPMDTSGFALPKPPQREKSQPKDGRLIESPHQYRMTKRQLWMEQRKRCVREIEGKQCGRYMLTPAYGHRHHPGGRGIGGGKRNDSKTVLWCIECHLEEHAKAS
jgi:hypothetical protein